MTALSQTMTRLLEKAGPTASITAADLVALADAIMAPAHLKGLFFLLPRLLPVLKTAKVICQLAGNDQFMEKTIEPAITVSEILLSISEEIATDFLLDDLFTKGNSAEETFKGILEEYPLYCSLGHAVADPQYHPSYTHLLAQIFLASHVLAVNEKHNSEQILKVYRGVRMLSLPKYTEQLSKVPAQPLTPQAFFEAIHRGKPGQRLKDAIVLIEKALVQHAPRHPVRPAVTKKASPRRSGGLSKAFDDEVVSQAVSWTGTEVIESKGLNPEEEKVYLQHGGHPGEFTAARDAIAVVAIEERQYDRTSLNELAIQARQASSQIAMRNQMFPLAWQDLNQYDVATLLAYLSGTSALEKPLPCEAAVKKLLLIMFWSASPLDRALKMTFYYQGGARLESGDALHWDEGKVPFFRLLSPGPELCDESTAHNYPQARPTVQYSQIPLPNMARHILTSLLPDSDRSRKIEGCSVFDRQEDAQSELRHFLTQCLTKLNRQHGTRLTPTRISQHLVRRLARQPGQDLPSAALYFGYSQRLAVTRIHYTHAPLLRLEQSYRQMCQALLTPLGHSSAFPAQHVNSERAAVGTPWCPKPESVQELVQALIDCVDVNRPDPGDSHRVATFHNYYAIYTACFIAFATGYRAVRDPSFNEGLIDEQSGLALICDKSDDLGYSNRLVWIPDECRRQIRYYREHLVALYDRTGAASPALFNMIKNHCGKGRPAQLFHIDIELSEVELLGPGLLQQILSRLFNYHLPANANRHYLKSHLLQDGCPPEIIETYLGHWELGQESWHGLSGLRPGVFHEFLKRHVPRCLEQDGWRALHGFLP